jgi:hypothetical protein
MTSLIQLAELWAASPAVLISDGDDAEWLLKHLTVFDCELVLSRSEEEILSQMVRRKFDLMFVDLESVSPSTLGVLKARWPDRPLVLLLNERTPLEKVLACGPFTVLRKPLTLSIEALMALLRMFKIKVRFRAPRDSACFPQRQTTAA